MNEVDSNNNKKACRKMANGYPSAYPSLVYLAFDDIKIDIQWLPFKNLK